MVHIERCSLKDECFVNMTYRYRYRYVLQTNASGFGMSGFGPSNFVPKAPIITQQILIVERTLFIVGQTRFIVEQTT